MQILRTSCRVLILISNRIQDAGNCRISGPSLQVTSDKECTHWISGTVCFKSPFLCGASLYKNDF